MKINIVSCQVHAERNSSLHIGRQGRFLDIAHLTTYYICKNSWTDQSSKKAFGHALKYTQIVRVGVLLGY